METWHKYDAICIPSNSVIKGDGSAVMGAGFALACARKWPALPRLLGMALQTNGNIPNYLGTAIYSETGELKLIQDKYSPGTQIWSFPTKNHWMDPGSLPLIEKSCKLMRAAADVMELDSIALPRPGVGMGKLSWDVEVKPAVLPLLDQRFVITYI